MSIDWADKRAIGLKCYLWRISGEWKESILAEVRRGSYFIGEDGFDSYHCRIAQGEKTPYDGKGQPVPDGVVIDVWGVVNPPDIGEMDFHSERVMSHEITWLDVTDYQIQEMPEEKHPLYDYDTIEHEEVTVPIKQSTIDEIVECLEDSKNNYTDINSLIEEYKGVNAECTNEIAKIDNLIKELKG